MFENLNWWEIGALLVVALLIFGDKLPNVINDGLRMLRNLRNMANNATSDLSRELGTDIQLTDLHPKTFIRKHLLSEDDEAALRKPLEGLQRDLSDVARAADLRTPATKPPAQSPAPATPAAAPEVRRTSYDLDAT